MDGDRERNARIADRLREMAELLTAQQANPFRIQAYRRAADRVDRLDRDVGDILAEGGRDALEALPDIGDALALAIEQMVRTGRWPQLDRMRGEADPAALFRSIPGVGPELAKRIHDHLNVDTLEQLEVAAHDGRLQDVPGIGPRRAAMLRATLAGMLSRPSRPGTLPRPSPGEAAGDEPPVDVLLDVDAEYRRRAEDGDLPTIAPRRFNPSGERWLPILHTRRGDWEVTALYSNTGRAHDLGRVKDWVVIYFHRGGEPERQRTVVTEHRGRNAGQRVVRGREP